MIGIDITTSLVSRQNQIIGRLLNPEGSGKLSVFVARSRALWTALRCLALVTETLQRRTPRHSIVVQPAAALDEGITALNRFVRPGAADSFTDMSSWAPDAPPRGSVVAAAAARSQPLPPPSPQQRRLPAMPPEPAAARPAAADAAAATAAAAAAAATAFEDCEFAAAVAPEASTLWYVRLLQPDAAADLLGDSKHPDISAPLAFSSGPLYVSGASQPGALDRVIRKQLAATRRAVLQFSGPAAAQVAVSAVLMARSAQLQLPPGARDFSVHVAYVRSARATGLQLVLLACTPGQPTHVLPPKQAAEQREQEQRERLRVRRQLRRQKAARRRQRHQERGQQAQAQPPQQPQQQQPL